MSKSISYRYNAETDTYERIYPTWGSRFRVVTGYLIAGLITGVTLFLLAYYVFASPTEENLRKENAQLKAQYSTLRRRLDNSLKVMDRIRERDDNFYRVLLQMEPLTDSERYAGLDNEERYRYLSSLPESKLMIELTRNLDILDRQLYVQSKSFDALKNTALQQHDKLAHVPSVLPINIKDYTVASGYGHRIDPVYGTAAFHAGLDMAAPMGTPVFATADGRISEAGWRGGYGNCIDVDHGYNYLTRYGHLSMVGVVPGQYVKRGQKIGEVGSTGKSTGPHLHYEVRFRGEPQNPVNYYFMDITPQEYAQMIRQADNAGHVMD